MATALLGGIGLFLMGMLLLTDGLKAAAGDALKRILTRFTARPLMAFASGVTVTAMVQSSSATTVATIGFVSAGLLTFSQAMGVVIGGSVGTTTTGWIVSLLGIKLSVGKLAMPLIGFGALMRLLLKGRGSSMGLALAGFGLIFVGIETLQAGMAGLADRLRPEDLPSPSFLGRALLVGMGIGLTVVMQSSSAAVATTITAFHAGSLNLAQALSLVIGASIGTTVTAGLASIGASVPARRTALSHILFNTFAAMVAFAMEPMFLWFVDRWEATDHLLSGATWVAVFHSGFHLVAACLVLPVVGTVADWIVRWVPDKGPALTRHLDRSLLQLPQVAIEAVRRVLVDCAVELLLNVERRLARDPVQALRPMGLVRRALEEVRDFLGQIPPFDPAGPSADVRLSVVHALDHLDQLAQELGKVPQAGSLVGADSLEQGRQHLLDLVQQASSALGIIGGEQNTDALGVHSQALAGLRRQGRDRILKDVAYAGLSPEQANRRLDTLRWLDSAGYHAWRAVSHLRLAMGSALGGAGLPDPEAPRPPEPAGYPSSSASPIGSSPGGNVSPGQGEGGPADGEPAGRAPDAGVPVAGGS